MKERELSFMEGFHTPRCLIESLFHDFRNISKFSKDKFGNLRLYQLPLYSHESLIDFETTAKYHNLNDKEKFKLRKNVGDLYCFGGRKFGKSLVSMILDLCNAILTKWSVKCGFSSVDLIHIKPILNPIKSVFLNHPICKLWKTSLVGAPNFNFIFRNGFELASVNFALGSTSPGKQWLGRHDDIIFIEEGSMETDEVFDKRKDAESEFGAIHRVSGMTDFVPDSPAGKMYYGEKNKHAVLNLPQFVNPFFDEEEKQKRLEQYGGENSVSYKIYVKGEIVENGKATFDMQRIREQCFLKTKKGEDVEEIKRFEVTKENFEHFKNLIIVERPKVAERIFINSDIGEHVTEIIVHTEIEEKYKYIYNIVLYNLTYQEHIEVFDYLIAHLQPEVLGFDCGEGKGKALYSHYEKEFPKENLVWYDGSKNIEVEPDTDEKGNILIKNGEVVYRKERMASFAVYVLKNTFYEGQVKIPLDFKFATQFSKVVTIVTGNSIRYACTKKEDHHFDAWKVFAIAKFLKSDFNKTKPMKKKVSLGICGNI